jgi:hypothetical protein
MGTIIDDDPSASLRLTEAAVPAPSLAIKLSKAGLSLRFATSTGQKYCVERCAALNASGGWQAVIGAEYIPGTGGQVELYLPISDTAPQRFYRVRVLP